MKFCNALPRNIRDLKGRKVEKLKKELDKFLLELLDVPLIPGYTASSLMRENIIVDYCNWLRSIGIYEKLNVWDTPWPWAISAQKCIIEDNRRYLMVSQF